MQGSYGHLVNGLVAWFSGVSVNVEPKVKGRSPSEGNGANGFRINSLGDEPSDALLDRCRLPGARPGNESNLISVVLRSGVLNGHGGSNLSWCDGHNCKLQHASVERPGAHALPTAKRRNREM